MKHVANQTFTTILYLDISKLCQEIMCSLIVHSIVGFAFFAIRHLALSEIGQTCVVARIYNKGCAVICKSLESITIISKVYWIRFVKYTFNLSICLKCCCFFLSFVFFCLIV